MAKGNYNIDTASYERLKKMSKEDVNKLLSNVYKEGIEFGKTQSTMKDKYVTESELKDILSSIKGIGATRIEQAITLFKKTNKERSKKND